MFNGYKYFKTFAMITTIMLAFASFAQATARLQVIHNAADPAAHEVDVYVNGDIFIDDFAFRDVTPFSDVPSGVELSIAIAPGNSSSVNDALATFPVTLDENGTYIAIANGVLAPNDFASNPGGEDIGFTLFLEDEARETSGDMNEVDILVVHGVTDAPAVDIIARDVGTLLEDVPYGAYAYITVPEGAYTLDITPANDNNTIVASYDLDLNGLGGGAAVALASGFLNPDQNQGGLSFNLLVGLPDGTEFTLGNPTARLQVVHNAADPAAAEVDVYVNDDLFLDNFAFRDVTPYVDVPAEVELNIGIAPPNSSSSDDAIATFPVTLANDGTYMAIANGVLSPNDFVANPDGLDIGFTLFLEDEARETSGDMNDVDILVVHGVTDAPAVDIIACDVGTLLEDVPYGAYAYITVPEGAYTLDITPANDNNTIVASYDLDLNGLGGGAAVALASGFLNPGQNQDGFSFNLLVGLPDGTEFLLGEPTARLQVIHNAADPAASEVDIYVNDDLFINNFEFRTGTAFVDVPAEVELTIGVAPSTSNSADDAIATFPVTLASGETYIAIANGVLSPDDFAENPDGVDTGFTLFLEDEAREMSGDANEVDILVVHGVTDAPMVDIVARDVGTLLEDVPYGAWGYVTVPAGNYILDITLANDNNAVVASYDLDVSGLGGGAAVAAASGFLTPADNQNGAAFNILVSLPDGTEFLLEDELDVEDDAEQVQWGFHSLQQNYPNPFNPATTIAFSLPAREAVSLKVYDVDGRLVETVVSNDTFDAGLHQVQFDGQRISSGVYFYQLQAGDYLETRKMTLLK